MKEKRKQWFSILLVIMILLTSGIVPENIVKAATSDKSTSPDEQYPYYCSFCEYYYNENKSHWCDVLKTCSNCNGSGHLNTVHTCTSCKNGIVYCTNLSSYSYKDTAINDENSEPKFSFWWTCGYCNESGSGIFTMSGVNSGTTHRAVVIGPCEECNGTQIAYDKCTNCNGKGKVTSREVVRPNKYRIVFDANGGILNGVDHIYTSGYNLSEEITASKDGCDFLGWNSREDAAEPESNLILNMPRTLYAVFSSRTNRITFDSQGASSNGTESIEAEKGSIMPSITIPKKEYTVTFHKNTTDSGAVIGSSSLKGSFAFQGYYGETNGNGTKYYNADGSGAKNWDEEADRTLYAFWTNNGITLPTASRIGYTFKGWSVSSTADSGMAANEAYKPAGTTTLYAVWKKNTYTISYDLAGGVIEKANPSSYDVETSTFLLNNPVREGYQFNGWTGSNGETAQTSVSIAKGSTGNKNYRAVWTAKTTTPYKVEIYKMKLDGTYASLADEIKNLVGTTDTKITAAKIAEGYLYSGFTYKNAKVGEISASEMTILGNGSSVLKLFYERNQYKFDIGAYSHVNIKGTTAAGNYYQGAELTLKAQPDKGYHWVKWQSSNPSLLSDNTGNNIIITMPVGAVTMTPKVEPNADTSYKLIIHRETLQGDYSDASEDIIVEKKGITDTGVNAAALAASYQYEGFTYNYAKAYDSESLGANALRMKIDGDGTSELHLYYSRNSYKLTIGDYDSEKVATSETDATVLYGEKVMLEASALPGYSFSRWDSSDTTVQADLNTGNAMLVMAASDITMTPMASEVTYTVVFEANDSNSHTPENNIRATAVPERRTYGYHEEITMPGCTRKGFRFLGWSTKNGSVVYAQNQKVSRLSSTDKDIVTMYAQWEENKYSIQFLANDSTRTAHNPAGNVKAAGTTPSTASFYYTDNILLPNNGFKRNGFVFKGWSVEEGSNAVKYNVGDFVHNLCENNNGTITLYAAWAEKSYSISFEPGDSYCYGSEDGIEAKVTNPYDMSLSRVYYTDGFTMPECQYIRPGFTFAGWSKDKNASKKTYKDSSYRGELQPGDRISDMDTEQTHIYYPVWLENQYTFVYHANDDKENTEDKGSIGNKENIEDINTAVQGSIASKTVYYTESVLLPDSGFQRTGFAFRGWSVKEGSHEVSFAKKEKVLKLAENGTVNLYAAWKENSYRISFKPNDNYCYGAAQGVTAKVSNPDAMDSIKLGYTEYSVFPECSYSRKGFTFLGWSINKNDTLRTYEDEENEEVEEVVAVIQPGTEIHSFSSIDGEELIYYPVWKENSYRISFDANDECNASNPENEPKAEGEMEPIENIYYTQEITLPSNQFTRTGFSYKGWADKKGDNSKQHSDKGVEERLSSIDGDTVILYAAWKEHSYTINFKKADNYCYASDKGEHISVSDKDAMQPISLKYTDDWEIATDYSRAGFTFLGYSYTNDNKQVYERDYEGDYEGKYHVPFADGEKLNRLSAKDKDELTVYTIWKENQYSILFDKNEENAVWSADKTVKNVYYTESWSLDALPSAVGYQFKGYSENSDAEHVQYNELIEMARLAGENKDGETKTIYALWKPNQLVITYESEGVVSDYSQAMQYGRLDAIADEKMTGFYKEEKTLLGWSKEAQEGFGTREDVDYKVGEESRDCFGLAEEAAVNKLHLYAVWSIAVPKIIEQTKTSNLGTEVKPHTSITVSVAAIGFDMTYQWYCRKEPKETVSPTVSSTAISTVTSSAISSSSISISDIAIENAVDSVYTIPAEDIIEENDGMAYYCVITGNSGQVISEPVFIHIYGTPEVPDISIDNVVNENGWSSQDICISVSGGAIKGSREQTEYVYSFDKVEWFPYKKLIWTENTTTEGKTIYFKAYNKDCPELMSSITSCVIRKDDENPNIINIEEDIVIERQMQQNVEAASESSIDLEEENKVFRLIINAEDTFSGISGYAFLEGTNQPKNDDWKKENIFKASAGQYRVYAMDNAGNIAMKGFIINENGYILPSGESGSYVDEEQCYIIGEGIANWDKDMVIDKSKITNVIIEDGIIEIPNGFFEGFTGLNDVTIPDSVVKIGEHAFDGVPKNMVIHASFGSAGEEAAKKHHYTEYKIEIDGKEDKIPLHYCDIIVIPSDELYVENKTLAGWGMEPGRKDFHRDEPVSELSNEMNGDIKLYPIYTDAYIDENGVLHITGNNTKYLDDIIPDKDTITEIMIESNVTILPEQIPDDFKNLKSLTLSEELKSLPESRFDGMPVGAVVHRPWENTSDNTEDSKGDNTEDNSEDNTEGTDNKGDNTEGNIGDSSEGTDNTEDSIGENAEGSNNSEGIGNINNSNNTNNNNNTNNSNNTNNTNNNNNSNNAGTGIFTEVYTPSIIENGSKQDVKDGNDENDKNIDANQENNNTTFPTEQETITNNKQDYNIQEITGGNFIVDGQEYSSLEEALEILAGQVQENERKIDIYANGSNIILGDLNIPENIRLIVNDKLTIDGDLTISGGEFFVMENSEVIINGGIIAAETSNIHIDGKLTVNENLITEGSLYIGKHGVITISKKGFFEILQKGSLENHGTIDGSIKDNSKKKETNDKKAILIKTNHSTIVIEKGKNCKIKSLKGAVKWKIKDNKIAKLKKKGENLILTGKKTGKTVLIGNWKKYTYKYAIQVKEHDKQIKLAVKEEKKSSKQILTASGVIMKNVVAKKKNGTVTMKLLHAGKNVEWQLSGKKLLKESGNVAIVKMGNSKKCVLTAKYKGKIYKCCLSVAA